jgi:hypothetical protein
MIDADELAICRRRGHAIHASDSGWLQCGACGMWILEKRTIEEREDEPPESELGASLRSKRLLAWLQRHEFGPEAH